MSNPVQSYPSGESGARGAGQAPGGPAPGGATPDGAHAGQVPGNPPPEPVKRTNGFAVASLIFGIIGGIPLGLIFGIIGLIRSKTYRSGKVTSWIGIVLSLLWIAPVVALTPRIVKASDPGCVAVEANIATLDSKLSTDSGNVDAFKADMETMIAYVKDGARKTGNAKARDAMNAMAADLQQVMDALNSGNAPSQDVLNRLEPDGNAIDAACGRS